MKIQTNLTIPSHWKKELDSICNSRNYTCTHSDLIREAIREYYNIDKLSEKEENNCQDFNYFCEKYFKILNPTEGLISLKLYDFQKRWVKFISEDRHSISTKFRQCGMTTITSLWFLWKAFFTPNCKLAILSKTNRESYALQDRIKLTFDNLPPYFHHKLYKNNRNQISFVNGSSISFIVPQQARSFSLDYLFIDEAAFIDNLEKEWKAIYPCIINGKCIVASTTNGINNWFADMYRNNNSFQKFHMEYTEHPEFNNPQWIEKTRKALGEKGWRQEILQEFISEYIPQIDIVTNDMIHYAKIGSSVFGSWQLTENPTDNEVLGLLNKMKNSNLKEENFIFNRIKE